MEERNFSAQTQPPFPQADGRQVLDEGLADYWHKVLERQRVRAMGWGPHVEIRGDQFEEFIIKYNRTQQQRLREKQQQREQQTITNTNERLEEISPAFIDPQTATARQIEVEVAGEHNSQTEQEELSPLESPAAQQTSPPVEQQQQVATAVKKPSNGIWQPDREALNAKARHEKRWQRKKPWWDRELTCTDCNKPVLRKNWTQHMIGHRSGRSTWGGVRNAGRFRCQKCGEVLHYQRSLEQHQRDHEVIEKYDHEYNIRLLEQLDIRGATETTDDNLSLVL